MKSYERHHAKASSGRSLTRVRAASFAALFVAAATGVSGCVGGSGGFLGQGGADAGADAGNGGAGLDGNTPHSNDPPSPAELALVQLMQQQYPSGTLVTNIVEDPNIEVTSMVGSSPIHTALPVLPGDSIPLGIGFASQMDQVDAVCVGFGSPNQAWCVPSADLETTGDGTAGAALLQLSIPLEICSMLSNICHDIQCYEFARTSNGTFSRANINQLAAVCGGCDEPSCQPLLQAGMCGPGQCLADTDCNDGEVCAAGQCVGEGPFRFTLSWSSVTDFDLYVTTPNASTISYSNRSADTGELDVDNTAGGAGAIENIFFSAPPNGTYQYRVDHFSGAAGDFTVRVLKNGSVVATQSGTLSGGATSDTWSVTWP